MKKPLNISVFDAARERISFVFDNFPKIYVSFSGGKDSSVMLHMVMNEAINRNRKIGVLFVDLEGQYKLTIDHISEVYRDYSSHIVPFWVALPLHLRNAVSQYQPHWICWDPSEKERWIREAPSLAITDEKYFPFFKRGMEFEEFVPEFGKWFGQGNLTACFVGIRSDESLNRYRTIASSKKQTFERKRWTTWCGDGLYNIYPIYDWRTRDIWIYNGKTGSKYNRLYDRMHQAGMTIHQMRICQPYGDDQRKGLWLFHIVEPETWGKVVARVSGANQGALYASDQGNILGVGRITKPEGMTWEGFSMLLLGSMPTKTSEHFKNKISVFLKWYQVRGFPDGVPDDGPLEKDKPSWKRICKSLLRNDYWCKGLSFTQHKSEAYEKYLKLMKKRRSQWNLI
jgi:predicted phosphoadenosine phosphosulfate sulfurtransferase